MKAIEVQSLDGIFYFSSQKNAAEFFEMTSTNVWYYLHNPEKNYKGWSFRYVNGDETIGIYIDPNRVGMRFSKWDTQQKACRKNLMRAAMDPEYAKQWIMDK